MARFYANIKRNRGGASRMGTKGSGMYGHIRGWELGAVVEMSYNKEKDRDEMEVFITGGSLDSGNKKWLGTYTRDESGEIIKID